MEGEIFGLLGPNGAGKTSTIRMLLNIITPTSGTVSFDEIKEGEQIYNSVGYLPEDRGLYKKSKAIDVIKYFGTLKGLSKTDVKVKASEWLKLLKVENLADKRIEELSKGNKQKIQFISAVVHDPKILILDEPFSGFDPINQELITNIISKQREAGRVIIISTHLMNIAESLCTDILLINNGKEVLKGKLDEIKKRFGKNTYRVEFIGDISFIEDLPEIIDFKYGNGNAEISLADGTSPSSFLKKITNEIEVTHFTYLQPTLNNIFLETLAYKGNYKT